jgi:hypothetical protein
MGFKAMNTSKKITQQEVVDAYKKILSLKIDQQVYMKDGMPEPEFAKFDRINAECEFDLLELQYLAQFTK